MPDANEGTRTTPKMGWLPDYPDFRDYHIETAEIAAKHEDLGHKPVKKMLGPLNLSKAPKAASSVDLRQWCSPVEDQGGIGSCTANAGVGVIEYYERRAFGKHIDASRLFLYKVTRNLLNWTGDTGAFLRTTMGAMALFGVLPEEYWKYIEADYDVEPSAFCYSFARNYQAIQYFRLDPFGTSQSVLLARIKLLLKAGLPSMFGFTVYNSYSQARYNGGEIPYPCPQDWIVGGHAVVAVGYDDKRKIKNTNCNKTTTGAFLIRNSWGTGWGDKGYGWLPYAYVEKGLATDWWVLFKNEWADTNKFGF